MMRILPVLITRSTRNIEGRLDNRMSMQTTLQKVSQGLPWWVCGEESTCQWRRHEFNPWSKKIPHAAEQLSPCATTAEPVLRAYGQRLPQPPHPRAHAPQQETPPLHSKDHPTHHSWREPVPTTDNKQMTLQNVHG